MPHHRFGDLVVASDLDLPEVERVRGRPACRVRLVRELDAIPPGRRHDWRTASGVVELTCQVTPRGHRLGFPGLAEFDVAGRGEEILCRPDAGGSPATLRHLLLDQVLPRVLGSRGSLVLHAGGVVRDGRAVAFLGPSGAGKSTLCAAFAAAGAAILADDCLIANPGPSGRIHVRPAYAGLRLHPDSLALLGVASEDATPVAHYTGKRRVPARAPGLRFRAGPAPLGGLFVLDTEPGRSVAITRLAVREAFVALLRGVFQLHLEDRSIARSIFEGVLGVCRSVPVHRLAYPRDLSLLPQLVLAVTSAACRPARSARGTGRDSAPDAAP
jgi:hypothetical protein